VLGIFVSGLRWQDVGVRGGNSAIDWCEEACYLGKKRKRTGREDRMDTRYDPGKAEGKWYDFWLQKDYFTPRPAGGKPFVIVMPPPNITGPLTMGHVLNMSLQDVLVRWNMLNGRETLWLPGKDHAGIATQNAVERRLAREKLTRHDLGREEFVKRVWEWKEVMSAKITEQIRHLGCACDWTRERFTVDEGLAKAVRAAFVTLYDEGLIYRGEYVVNACPRCLTTLADEEVEREDKAGKLYYIRYPLEEGGHITVATTRPETMLGDVAVAVNPGDPRYKASIGRHLTLPIVGRRMPVIADEFVDPEFGTGAVKVTPAHDADDYEMGKRHGLPSVVIMDRTGTMSADAGEYEGLDRFEARKRIVERLEKDGSLEKTTDYALSVGRCYRCEALVEPLLSTQYFVKMKTLAEPALDAVRQGRIRLHPDRWTKVYFNWMENIRDWCISRQLWWGHRIPVWYCTACDAAVSALEDPQECPSCGGPVRQEEDVLDTWFSSWLWPFSTLGWPEDTEDLKRYYPTSVLVTAPDIIFFWVARMIMAGFHFMGDIPFADVYLHGLIRDERGRKMSKSLGNSPDPSDLIRKYGADALRFTTVSLTPKGSDILFGERQVEVGRNFANKVWNAARLVKSASKGVEPGEVAGAESDLSDRWILSRTAAATGNTARYIENFELNQGARAVYDFIWHELCDWYLEMAKERLYSEDLEVKARVAGVALKALRQSLRLLHPFMPFLTEELWSGLELGEGSILDATGETEGGFPVDADAESAMALMMGIVEAVRNVRGEMGVHPSRKVEIRLRMPEGSEAERVLASTESYIKKLAKVSVVAYGPPPEDEGPVATGIVGDVEVRVPLGGVIDIDVEKTRLDKEIDRLGRLLSKSAAKVENPEFGSKAPPEVVASEKEKIERYRESLAKLKKNLSILLGS
jgi:valyl-tRNA synthetase